MGWKSSGDAVGKAYNTFGTLEDAQEYCKSIGNTRFFKKLKNIKLFTQK